MPRAPLRHALAGRVAGAACACWLAAAGSARAEASTLVTLPVTVHVAELDGRPVVEARFVADRIERANAIFAPHGVGFRVRSTRSLAAAHAVIETRADRDALALEATRGAIDCFVVQSLRDVDEPGRMRRGVHWHAAAPAGAHFVIPSSIAGLDVLAHELGHYLGNHAHSEVPGNLMSHQLGPELPVLDAAQQRKLERAAATCVDASSCPWRRTGDRPGQTTQPRVSATVTPSRTSTTPNARSTATAWRSKRERTIGR